MRKDDETRRITALRNVVDGDDGDEPYVPYVR